jgi:hypothetical protein
MRRLGADALERSVGLARRREHIDRGGRSERDYAEQDRYNRCQTWSCVSVVCHRIRTVLVNVTTPLDVANRMHQDGEVLPRLPPPCLSAGDNPERLLNESTFARLCGVPPISAGSGKTDGYHRLHRGGDRQANSALWTIVLVRMASHPETKAYVERRTKEGKGKPFIMRCLKRHVAREIFKLLPRQNPLLTP